VWFTSSSRGAVGEWGWGWKLGLENSEICVPKVHSAHFFHLKDYVGTS